MKKVIIGILVIVCIAVGAAYLQFNQSAPLFTMADMPETGELNGGQINQVIKTNPSDFVFYDVRTPEEYAKEHTNSVANTPVAMFETDENACEKIKSSIVAEKRIVFVCPFGPRAKEMYYNLVDSKEDGACGFEKKNLYFLTAKVKFNPEHLKIK